MVHFFSGRGRTIWNLLTVLALVWDTRPFWSRCWWCSCTESRREAEPITKFQACHHHTHVVLDIGENDTRFWTPKFFLQDQLMRFYGCCQWHFCFHLKSTDRGYHCNSDGILWPSQHGSALCGWVGHHLFLERGYRAAWRVVRSGAAWRVDMVMGLFSLSQTFGCPESEVAYVASFVQSVLNLQTLWSVRDSSDHPLVHSSLAPLRYGKETCWTYLNICFCKNRRCAISWNPKQFVNFPKRKSATREIDGNPKKGEQEKLELAKKVDSERTSRFYPEEWSKHGIGKKSQRNQRNKIKERNSKGASRNESLQPLPPLPLLMLLRITFPHWRSLA